MQCGEVAAVATTEVSVVPRPGRTIAVPNHVIPSNTPIDKGNIGNCTYCGELGHSVERCVKRLCANQLPRTGKAHEESEPKESKSKR